LHFLRETEKTSATKPSVKASRLDFTYVHTGSAGMRVNEAAHYEVWCFRSFRNGCPPGTEKEKDVRNSGSNRLDTNRGIPLFFFQ
jgi:hypothetical protein